MNHEQREKLRQLRELYTYETDKELERKREVYRSHIISQTLDEIEAGRKSLDFNRAAYDALSDIVHERERVGRRRERNTHVLQWLGFLGPFILGLISGVSASPYFQKTWDALVNIANVGAAP